MWPVLGVTDANIILDLDLDHLRIAEIITTTKSIYWFGRYQQMFDNISTETNKTISIG